MKIKKLLYILATSLIFSGCSNLLEDNFNTSSSVSGSNSETKGEASLKIALADDSSRTALPQYSKSDLTLLTLRYAEKYADNVSDTSASEEVTVGIWQSEAEMSEQSLAFQTGTYTFRFYVVARGGAVFGDEQTLTINKGENNLTFSPTMEYFLTDYSGNGNLSIKMRYNTKNVAKVTAGIYSIRGEEIPGFNDEELTLTSSGQTKYEKTDIPAGNCIVIFKFFADEAKTLLLGTYREYASIVDGLTSTSDCVVNSLGNLFKIELETNGGTLKNASTFPGSYTRQSADITLPDASNLVYANHDFAGWYTDPDFTGSEMSFIPSGTAGDLVLYARWIPKIIISYSPNGGSIKTDRQIATPDSDGTITLKTPDELGLTPPKTGIKFLGWGLTGTTVIPSTAVYHEEAYDFTPLADSEDTNQKDSFVIYAKDSSDTEITSAKILTKENLVLYAIWTLSQINPDPNNKNAARSLLDFDGDGLTDWEEVYQYHTDPMCKDTDGDGWTDKQELTLYNKDKLSFSPLIADTPFVDVEITGKPEIYYIYTNTQGKTITEIQSTTEGTTGSHSETNTNTKSFNMTHGWNASTTHKWGKKWTADNNFVFHKTETSYEGGFTIGFSGSYSSGDTYTFAKSDTEGWSKSWQNGRNISESNSKTITGGKVVIPVKLKNKTEVGYTIKAITIAINKLPYGKKNLKVPVGSYSTNSAMTLRPNSESGQYNITLNLTTAETEQLLKYSNTILVEISGFQITTFKDSQSGNNDFTEALTEVRARTASVYIDCGLNNKKRIPKTYNVAVKNKFNPEATSLNDQYQPVTLKEIFNEILQIEENSTSKNGYELYTHANGKKTLKTLYGVTNGATSKEGSWYIEHTRMENGILKKDQYPFFWDGNKLDAWNFEDITVNAGDEINIYFDVDMDEDNVPLNVEKIHGISDYKKDTDGDYLSDYEELYGWYKPGLHKEKYRNEIQDYADNEDNRVYSNPALKDTDGDGLNDYSDGAIVDPDPIFSYIRNDRRINTAKCFYTTNLLSEKKEKLDLTEHGNEDEANPATMSVPIETDMDTIYLDITPRNDFAVIQYQTTVKDEHGTETYEWRDLKSTSKISLNMGKNIIKLKSYVTNYTPENESEKTEYFWNVVVISTFKDLKNFNVEPLKNEDGAVIISWDAYSDTRTDASTGGYVLYGIKSKTEPADIDSYLTQTKLMGAGTSTSNLKEKDEFFIKLTSDQIGSTNTVTLNLESQKDYWIYLYAYAHKSTADTFIKKQLAKDSFKTELSRKTRLCFYAHYVKDIEDEDGGCDPQYYWSFAGNNDCIDLTKCALTEKKTQDFDVKDYGDALYYTFGDDKFVDYYESTPVKFSTSTKKIISEVSRDEEHIFTLYWNAWEKDPGSSDDYLGYVAADFHYYPAEDKWTCTWKPGGGKGEGALPFYGSSTIKKGEKTNGNVWKLYNPSYGEIEMHWDWSWDVETADDLKNNQGK